jgi:2-polyprenyl-6-methoxyphenol hydroxylase-like FAD-dependent oxidoreductase
MFLDGRSMYIAGGMEAKFVLYPIAEGTRENRRLTNWAVVARVSDGAGDPPRHEDWSRAGSWDDLGPHLKRFRLPFVDVNHLIETTGEFWEYPMCDRDPLPRWSHGRVTLLGDAAHPMYPVGSNGASQAILDARCLADLLVRAEHPFHALAAYESARLPPTAQIVRMNRKGGPEGVIDAVEALAPDGFANIDDVMSYEQRMTIVRGYASTAGFAQAQVNKGKVA